MEFITYAPFAIAFWVFPVRAEPAYQQFGELAKLLRDDDGGIDLAVDCGHSEEIPRIKILSHEQDHHNKRTRYQVVAYVREGETAESKFAALRSKLQALGWDADGPV